jgi:hypothetical protein
MNEEEKNRLKRIEIALLGDPEMFELGMAAKVDNMWAVYSSAMWFAKLITWVAIVTAGVGTIVGGAIHFLGTKVK